MGVNKYASAFLMASCNKKTCNHRKKKCDIFLFAIVIASTQLRKTRLRKYANDPKAYLGRCILLKLDWSGPSWSKVISGL